MKNLKFQYIKYATLPLLGFDFFFEKKYNETMTIEYSVIVLNIMLFRRSWSWQYTRNVRKIELNKLYYTLDYGDDVGNA